jgi:hypothetical protein
MFKKLKALFGNPAALTDQNGANAAQHAVLVHLDYGQDDVTDLHNIEDALRETVDKVGVGKYDVHEIAIDGSHGTLYLYGPDADILFTTIKPVLKDAACIKNPRIVLRYGPPDDPNCPELKIDISSH